MSASEPQEEVWTYTGDRVGQSGKLVESWVDPGGVSLLFKPGRAAAIGGLYRVRVIRAGDRVSMVGRPTFHAVPTLQDPRRPEWVALDAEANNRARAQREERRAIENGGLGTLTLADLRRQMSGMGTAQRAGLLSAAVTYLVKP